MNMYEEQHRDDDKKQNQQLLVKQNKTRNFHRID